METPMSFDASTIASLVARHDENVRTAYEWVDNGWVAARIGLSVSDVGYFRAALARARAPIQYRIGRCLLSGASPGAIPTNMTPSGYDLAWHLLPLDVSRRLAILAGVLGHADWVRRLISAADRAIFFDITALHLEHFLAIIGSDSDIAYHALFAISAEAQPQMQTLPDLLRTRSAPMLLAQYFLSRGLSALNALSHAPVGRMLPYRLYQSIVGPRTLAQAHSGPEIDAARNALWLRLTTCMPEAKCLFG